MKSSLRSIAQRAVCHGAPPQWFGYRWTRGEELEAYCARREAASCEVIHPEAVYENPLPRNVPDRAALPADAGWWGYSFWDVPARRSDPTLLATLPGARVLPCVDEEKAYLRPALLSREGVALELREISFRPMHGAYLRAAPPPRRLPRATWLMERCYDNYSHWLTAHLPKLLLLRDRDALAEVLLPARRPPLVDASMRLLGFEPEEFATFETDRPLEVEALSVLSTDRFRPELVRSVRAALPPPGAPPRRRVFISRAGATRRRLLNEGEVWPLLDAAGFERVRMEELRFEEQVALMGETAILFAPHGAGLTNMMFCAEGTHVVEIGDPSFPNPNFYALASALGHPYWLLAGEPVGEGHPLDRDLRIDPAAVSGVLARLPL